MHIHYVPNSGLKKPIATVSINLGTEYNPLLKIFSDTDITALVSSFVQ